MDNATLEKIVDNLKSVTPKNGQLLVGIDGLGAAGKSEFAKRLSKYFDKSVTVSIDEFYKPSEERTLEIDESISQDFDWDRMEKDIFQAIKAGGDFKYQAFDWNEDKPLNWEEVSSDAVVIVEGVYSTQDRFRDYYDHTFWLSTARDQRLENMIQREGREVAREWEGKWMKKEDEYWNSNPSSKVSEVVTQN